jgi:hypothetical protein
MVGGSQNNGVTINLDVDGSEISDPDGVKNQIT